MTDFGDVDEAAKELAAAHGRIRARHWPAEEEKLSLSAATRFIAGRLELEEAAKAVRTSEAALTAARAPWRSGRRHGARHTKTQSRQACGRVPRLTRRLANTPRKVTSITLHIMVNHFTLYSKWVYT